MRILVACQHYWPEPFNTADVCEGLVKLGHEVSVITALPNTGMEGNAIPNDWKGSDKLYQERNGVSVFRAKLHPRKFGALNRILNYLSFWRNANKLARKLNRDFDVALGYQFSPIMQVDPALVYAKKHGINMLLYCFDLWPVSLTAGGFSKSSLPYKWMERVSRRIYSQADRIAVTSPFFDKYFRDELGLNIPDSIYLPQYADDSFSQARDLSVPEGFDSRKINLTFAGNVGQTQSVITIVEAANLLKDRPNIVFHVVGSGSRLEQCKERSAELGLDNIIFHGRRPIEEMPAYYAASDAMLATFEASPMATYTLPRKVTTYLAAGRPVLAALDGETKRVISEAQCGFACAAGDARGLARIVREFADLSVDRRIDMGNCARRYYESHFTKELFFKTLEQALEDLVKEH